MDPRLNDLWEPSSSQNSVTQCATRTTAREVALVVTRE